MSKVRVTAELQCKKCDKKAEYNTDMLNHDHVICSHCGSKIKVVVYADQVDTDYKRIKSGQVIRTNPKVKMTKKQRRRSREATNDNN